LVIAHFASIFVIELKKVMQYKKIFTSEEAKIIGTRLGVDWSKYNLEQFRMGLAVELEHGIVNPATNVTNDDLLMTGKIALAHLNEIPDYYIRLEKMEKEGEDFWKSVRKYQTFNIQ